MLANRNIDKGKAFNWGKTSEDYAKYREIYPSKLFKRLAELGLCVKGQRVLDLGTGTGALPRGMYSYGATFTGVDVSKNQLAKAEELAAKENMEIEFILSPAEKIEFEENSFDVVTACECFSYFNKPVLIPKLTKMLTPGGRLVLVFFGWLPFESRVAQETERLILRYNPVWSGAGNRRKMLGLPQWVAGNFTLEKRLAFSVSVLFTRESWRGRVRACRGVGASLSPERVRRFDHEHALLLRKIAPQHFTIPHYAQVLVLKVIK